MEENLPLAPFQLIEYRINGFNFYEPTTETGQLSIDFEPYGTFIASQKKFILNFSFSASYEVDEAQQILIAAKLEADFIFSEETVFENIPEFFYVNSIAIVFPHLRALITAFTAMANVKRIILPLYNLTSLGEILKARTVQA
ncbi:MAG TPA: hypothetical protein PLP23_09220 [Panacibacter sp.]|nr:hypothetical protein [Panacibacter sp.]